MYKLATEKLDVVDEILGGDPSLLCSIAEYLDDNVKEAHIPAEEEQQRLNKTDVALVLHIPGIGRFNKYAHTNKYLTELNANILAVKAPTLPDEVVKTASFYLKKASKRWGVPFPEYLDKFAEEDPGHNVVRVDDINDTAWKKKLRDFNMMAKKAQLESTPESEFALPLEKKYPIANKDQIKLANTYFDQYHRDLGLGDALTFAKNLAHACENKGVKIDGEFSKYASLNINKFNNDFDKEIIRREKLAPIGNEKIANSYKNLRARKEEFGPIRTAALLEAIDDGWNASRLYGKDFKDPLISTLHTEKFAGVEIDGRMITRDSLDNLSDKDLSNIVDEGTKEELLGEDGLTVLESLPMPIRAALYEEM